MSTDGGTSLDRSSLLVTSQEACPHGWVQVSWDELARLCVRLAEQLRGTNRPEVVVALARAGYVPGAILASILRSDLFTLRVPSAGPRGRPSLEGSELAALRQRVGGRRVLVVDETTRTGESLAWAIQAAADAGAVTVRTAVLFLSPGCPRPDYHAAVADAHILQPWVQYCARVTAEPRQS